VADRGIDAPLRILQLEDSPRDAEIIREFLLDAGLVLDIDCASTEAGFAALLRQGGYDLVLADYSLPGYDGPAALRLVQGLCPGLPFICVSGAIGEDRAVELLKLGATDYVLKNQLARLPLSIHRALEERREQQARRSAEGELRRSESRYRTILQTAMDGYCLLDLEGTILDVNEAYCLMSGYAAEELLRMRITELDAVETPEETRAHIRRVVELGQVRFESRHRRKDGSLIDIETSVKYRSEEGGRLVSFLRDVSERKRAEALARRNLEEKEILLREVHHRVNNNLNIIYSLLNLQSARIGNAEEARSAFQETKDRIMAMALVHEELYRSNDYARVNMGEYLDLLTRQLGIAYGSGGRVRLSASAEGIELSVNRSIPCGLILNELITNAYKYAFPRGRAGEIRVYFGTLDEDNYELRVSDDGVGLSEEDAGRNGQSLGLSLVRLLVDQLEGSLEISGDAGTSCRIRLPRREGC
jgi:PAS domain S-box-containing protein